MSAPGFSGSGARPVVILLDPVAPDLEHALGATGAVVLAAAEPDVGEVRAHDRSKTRGPVRNLWLELSAAQAARKPLGSGCELVAVPDRDRPERLVRYFASDGSPVEQRRSSHGRVRRTERWDQLMRVVLRIDHLADGRPFRWERLNAIDGTAESIGYGDTARFAVGFQTGGDPDRAVLLPAGLPVTRLAAVLAALDRIDLSMRRAVVVASEPRRLVVPADVLRRVVVVGPIGSLSAVRPGLIGWRATARLLRARLASRARAGALGPLRVRALVARIARGMRGGVKGGTA